MTKICSVCKEEKSLESFSPVPTGRLGRHSQCNKCRSAKQRTKRSQNRAHYNQVQREWYERNNDHLREYRKQYYQRTKDKPRKRYPRKTIAERYWGLLEQQNFCCAICPEQLELRTGGYALDHDHATGKIRGFLCRPCNLGLGNFKDSPDLLHRAIDYLNQ